MEYSAWVMWTTFKILLFFSVFLQCRSVRHWPKKDKISQLVSGILSYFSDIFVFLCWSPDWFRPVTHTVQEFFHILHILCGGHFMAVTMNFFIKEWYLFKSAIQTFLSFSWTQAFRLSLLFFLTLLDVFIICLNQILFHICNSFVSLCHVSVLSKFYI